MDILYRKSVIEDIPYINELFIEMIKTVNERMIKKGIEPYKEVGFEKGYLETFYNNDDRIIFVALDNKKIVGFLSICKYKEENYIYLDDYCVNKDYRGKGIGSKLMEMACEYAKKEKIDCILTHVEDANTESINYYNSKGFVEKEKEGHRLLIYKKI